MVSVKASWGWRTFLASWMILLAAASAFGQALPSAEGTGASLWVGGEYSNFAAGFPNGSSVRLSGVGMFANYNWNHPFGIDAHARFLNFNSWNGETQFNLLAGPRYTFLHSDKVRPFASFQAGVVHIQYPFKIGTGTSFAMVPGGGLDYRLSRRLSVRGEYEFQFLPNSPNFTNEPRFGIKPNGISVGLAYRLWAGR
jgi:opacity protein-like surface antigen